MCSFSWLLQFFLSLALFIRYVRFLQAGMFWTLALYVIIFHSTHCNTSYRSKQWDKKAVGFAFSNNEALVRNLFFCLLVLTSSITFSSFFSFLRADTSSILSFSIHHPLSFISSSSLPYDCPPSLPPPGTQSNSIISHKPQWG